ncbi:peroxisomal multifunctional enzyme type 2-like [Watersipora subatra]|uniref:peroxisomal multifunctional enzyme type 2-like n=1 Tax=Watersipora subatra TaxID=2589382 RepID=UPI00355AFBE6
MDFKGRVALVTGAGNGLGRVYALQFAERGASVVVNDLGGDSKGGGVSSRPADMVVEEIRAMGGSAVANYDSVEFGEKLVDTAIKAFGRIDIVVNNAGILRDKSFARISDEDWDIIQKVHLKGAFKVTRAAWPYMKEQKYGRIIMVSSSSGIYGNFGQANYAAAKLGLLGLSNTLAKEGVKYNIRCNAIAPTAGSRMLATVMPQEMIDALKPEFVAPLVLYLCHESSEETGGLFEAAAGWIGKNRWQNAQGAFIAEHNKSSGKWEMTPEMVRDKWSAITDFSTNPSYMTSQADFQPKLMSYIEKMKGGSSSPQEGSEVSWSYNERDVILYALGIGVSTTQEDHLKFLFELSEDFCVLPTFPVLVAFTGSDLPLNKETTGIDIDPTKILHGEQYLEVYKPLATAGSFTTKSEVVDVVDKGSGALILSHMTSYDEDGEKVAFNQLSTFVVGAGGFGGKRSSDKAYPTQKAPNREPDSSMEEKTSIDQAALYRLSGDRNPLHLDPSFAAMGGFDKPILHGLCTMGYSSRHILAKYAGNDVSKFKAMKVRFAKPVVPGQTIRTNMWQDDNRVFFESLVVENGNKVITGGYVDLHSVSPQQAPANTSSILKSSSMFSEMSKRLTPAVIKKVGAVFQFNITQEGKVAETWTVDMKTPPGAVYVGEPKQGKPGVTLTISDDDLLAMASGKLDGQKAFSTGRLKLKGNIMLSMKLSTLFDANSKM